MYTQAEIEAISNSINLVDYFFKLEREGKVEFDKKRGNDYYFLTENEKYSVNERGYKEFKSGKGSQTVKAIMDFENLEWKDALEFIKDFTNNTTISKKVAERKTNFQNETPTAAPKITRTFSPNNEQLLAYFLGRGISKDILKKNSRQVHYELDGKKYFGIGIKNASGGYEVRNPMMKSKLGINDIIIREGRKKDEIVVFEGMTDLLSFLELLKANNKTNNRTLIALNSVSNVNRLFEHLSSFKGKMFLLLDGDKYGDKATREIQEHFPNNNVKDIRLLYQIDAQHNKDLNDYLIKKLNLKEEASIIEFSKEKKYVVPNGMGGSFTLEYLNFDQNKNLYNFRITNPDFERTLTFNRNSIKEVKEVKEILLTKNLHGHGKIEPEQEGISLSKSDGGENPVKNPHESSERNQSQQEENIDKGFGMGSSYVGDGFTTRSTGSNAGHNGETGGAFGEQENVEERESLDKGLLTTSIKELDILLEQTRGKKLVNEDVAQILSLACLISRNNTVELNEGLIITDELLDVCNQFVSGGVLKEGRGILDEYYTDEGIVNAIRNLIKDDFSGKKIDVLEPSIGTGNFISLTKSLNANSSINSFEINEVSAKIAKIRNPEITVNLRSFETEFIFDDGTKKPKEDWENKYDLVIGNPPYGEHRGFYKGLGEKPKVEKYEDYFVQRSLDSLKENGKLAMVLPSGWLNRQRKLNKADLEVAYRLPEGAFKSTKIGTDIVILKKSSKAKDIDISTYFNANPEKVLGEIKERKNQFGRLENYVSGDINRALRLIETPTPTVKTERIGNLFEDLLFAQTGENQIKLKEEKIAVEEKNIDKDAEIKNTIDKVKITIDVLEGIKFKTPAVIRKLKNYDELLFKLRDQPDKLTLEDLNLINEKANKIIVAHKKKETSKDYEIQDKVQIQKGILKYQFSKNDTVVSTEDKNNKGFSAEEIEAFKDTAYNGIISNPKKHKEFANYYNGSWVHDFYYAEGNIYEKLDQLEIDKVLSPEVLSNEQYETQKTKLINALPQPKALEQIIISPNHEFVHNFSLGTVKKTVWDYDTRKEMEKELPYSLADKFKDFVSELPHEAFSGSSSWEVRAFVNNETVTGSDKDRNALVRERRKAAANDLFKKFLNEELDQKTKENFVNGFNKSYNSIHVPDYSKFPLFSRIYKNFKGSELNLTEVQKAGIGRLTTKGVGLLAHEVGFGKTLSGTLAMHEAMERGTLKRPLIVVPNNSILKQWVDTIFETIPDAKLNVLGNLGVDFDLSKFDIKDGEITLVTYSGFNNIGFKEQTTKELADKFSYISENEMKAVNNISERDLEKDFQKRQEVVGIMKKGRVYDWEDFGFDHLTFDEVHNANHIVGKVKIEDRRFSSDFRNQNQATSKLGINTWMAAQYIQENNDGRNVTLLSATPFTNKPLEYYSVLSLVANNRLEDSGYFNVNTFFETFMEADNEMEIDAKGDIKYKANVRRFKNNSLFQQLLSEFIDIKGEDDNPELKRPNRINKEYKIEQNELTIKEYDKLNDSFEENDAGAILTHILNARLIAMSPYLSPFYNGAKPSVKEFIENSPKLKLTMDLIAQNKADQPTAGQIIYSELAVSEFPKLKSYLIDNVEFETNEVAVISGKTSKAQRLKIQDDFNSGKIKVVIGSSAIQEGMNLQTNTSDMYILSLPYNFTSLRQTEGRAWRQGNKWENVRINFMLTNNSIDVFMLQKLQSKQARYNEAMRNGADILDISDVNTQELKTSIITDPKIRAKIEIEVLKKQIENEKNKLLADSAFVLRKYKEVTKAQEKVAGAEQLYNAYKGYYDEEDGSNRDYWLESMEKQKQRIEEAKREVEQTITNLEEKGVNVSEITVQQEFTEKKLAELNEKAERLPEKEKELIETYEMQKEKQLKNAENFNFIKLREGENKSFFKLVNDASNPSPIHSNVRELEIERSIKR